MSNNYIEFFYDKENNYIARIHKNGQVCSVKNKNNLKVLKELLAKKKIYLYNQSGKVNNVDEVIRDFDKYMIMLKRMKKVTKPLRVLNNITSNMKISKKNPLIGKTLVAASLAGIIGITSIGIVNANKDDDQSDLVPQETIVYVDDNKEEVISPIVEEENTHLQDISFEEPHENVEELSKMMIENDSNMMVDEFHFSYEDRSNLYTLDKARRFEDVFEKYARMYGLDKEVLIAMGAQENYGRHSEHLHTATATGIMQIENVNLNSTIRAYNFETGEIEKFHITKQNVEDLDTNIKIAAMFLRSKLDEYNNNIPLAIQSYNYGSGNVSKVLNMCCKNNNINKDEIIANPLYQNWMNYRSQAVRNGDPEYVERIFSYLPSGYEINMLDRNGNPINMRVVNDNVNTKMVG